MVQEEAQQQNVQGHQKNEVEVFALMSMGEQPELECKYCGLSNHTSEKCWYGSVYSKPRREGGNFLRGQGNYRGARGGYRGRGRTNYSSNNFYNGNSSQGGYNSQGNYNNYCGYKKVAGNATSQGEPSNAELAVAVAVALAATTQKLETLMKYLPSKSGGHFKSGHDTDEKIDCNFAGESNTNDNLENQEGTQISENVTDTSGLQRRYERLRTQPTWMKDFVMSHQCKNKKDDTAQSDQCS
ncbi:hypothetical protein KSS87_011986 [Heliosperma pusillum]|nr:hypothetical protein KSS87_011986 [Heliosperma pusillum]